MEVFWGVKLPFLLSAYLFFKGAEIIKLIIIRGKINLYMTKKRGKPIQFCFKNYSLVVKKMQEIKREGKKLWFCWMQRLRKFFKALWFFAREKKNLSSKGIFFWLIICMYISSWRRYVYNLHIYSSCLRNSGVLKYSGMGSS